MILSADVNSASAFFAKDRPLLAKPLLAEGVLSVRLVCDLVFDVYGILCYNYLQIIEKS